MADNPQFRKFTAELRRQTAGLATDHGSDIPAAESSATARHQELLAAIRTLEIKLQASLAAHAGPLSATAALSTGEILAPPNEASTRGEDDRTTALINELQQLQQTIESTRHEIAELRKKGGHGTTPLNTAGDELDAVVQATESATESILAAAECIDDVLNRLRNQATGDDDTSGISEIGEQVIKIFESCNFQDITGQRITKVVAAMKFVEERVDRMIENLGGDEGIEAVISEMAEDPKMSPDDESHLLEGPQLYEENKVSQDDIDKMFG